jgi:hypothetical protein
MTESQAWRMIAEGFEEKAELGHRGIQTYPEDPGNIFIGGLCWAAHRLEVKDVIDVTTRVAMEDRIRAEEATARIHRDGLFYWDMTPEGNRERATLAYLFSEATK